MLTAVTFVAMSHPKIIEGSMQKVLLWLSVAFAVVILIDIRNVALPRMPILVILFLAFSLVSILWSTNDVATYYAVLYYSGMALLACILAANCGIRIITRGLAAGAFLVIALSIWKLQAGNPMVSVFNGGRQIFQGLYDNRNIMAYVMSIGLASLLAVSLQGVIGKTVKLIALGILGYVIYKVQSATGAIVAVVLVCGAGLIEGISRLSQKGVRFAKWAVLTLVGLGSLGIIKYLEQFTEALGKDATFSGRLPLWKGILSVWTDAKLGGYGWGSVWAYAWYDIDENAVRDRINSHVASPLHHGHNAVLDILVQVGIIGTAIYLGIIIVAFVQAIRLLGGTARDTGKWGVLVLAAVLVSGITEPMFAIPLGWFSVVLVAAIVSPRATRWRTRQGLRLLATTPDSSAGSRPRQLEV